MSTIVIFVLVALAILIAWLLGFIQLPEKTESNTDW